MIPFLARRLVIAFLTMLAISVLAFGIIRLAPGDFVDADIAHLSTSAGSVSDQELVALRAQYSYNQPIYIQYLKWVGGVAAEISNGHSSFSNR